MPAFLKIENLGVCPPEGFTVFGVSLANTSNNAGLIGQFGSGNKHSIAVLLRNELSPVVFAGTLKLEFSTRPQTVADSQASKDFNRVVVKYGGTDASGASRSSTEDLGFVLDYGKQDWNEVALAMREFVSNAIDRSIREVGDWRGRGLNPEPFRRSWPRLSWPPMTRGFGRRSRCPEQGRCDAKRRAPTEVLGRRDKRGDDGVSW